MSIVIFDVLLFRPLQILFPMTAGFFLFFFTLLGGFFLAAPFCCVFVDLTSANA